jgi:hypothetical protein
VAGETGEGFGARVQTGGGKTTVSLPEPLHPGNAAVALGHGPIQEQALATDPIRPAALEFEAQDERRSPA